MHQQNANGPEQAERASALEQALAALKTYDHGSSRALLLPIDRGVTAALADPKSRAQLEAELLRALSEAKTAPAREYLCSKLAIAGSAASVPALAGMLQDPVLSTPARNALERIGGKAAAKALRTELARTSGAAKAGLINSLAELRDVSAVGALKSCLGDKDRQVADAAAAALGRIASVRAARALSDYFSKAAPPGRRIAADAILVCSQRLESDDRQEAAKLKRLLLESPGLPGYIRDAATRPA